MEEAMLVGTDLKLADDQGRFVTRSQYMMRFIELFTIPRVRRATLAACTVMLAQQMCGSASILSFDMSSWRLIHPISQYHGVLLFDPLPRCWHFRKDRSARIMGLWSHQLRVSILASLPQDHV